MRTLPRYAAVALAAATLTVLSTTAAAAAPVAATGAAGQRLTVSATSGLDPDGQTVTVTGRGYDTAKGIYLAFCVVPATGQLPTPCGGGADTSGTGGSSSWISSHPPTYGQGVATPYGADGSFRTTLRVAAALNDTTDCRRVTCAVVTRNDHTRSSDRGQDVLVAVSFSGPTASDDASIGALGWVGIVGAGLLGIGVVLAGAGLLGRRHGRPVPVDA